MSTVTKLSPDVTNITRILNHQYEANARIQGMYKYEQYKRRLRVITGNSRAEQGGWKDKALDGLLGIYASAVPL